MRKKVNIDKYTIESIEINNFKINDIIIMRIDEEIDFHFKSFKVNKVLMDDVGCIELCGMSMSISLDNFITNTDLEYYGSGFYLSEYVDYKSYKYYKISKNFLIDKILIEKDLFAKRYKDYLEDKELFDNTYKDELLILDREQKLKNILDV